MLSRTADHLFWMSRYTERAENTARMLDVNYQTALLPQSVDDAEQGWRAVLGALCLLWLVARAGFLLPGPQAFAVAALCETAFFCWAALALAQKVGISPERFDNVIRGGRMDCGFYQTFMQYVLERDR